MRLAICHKVRARVGSHPLYITKGEGEAILVDFPCLSFAPPFLSIEKIERNCWEKRFLLL